MISHWMPRDRDQVRFPWGGLGLSVSFAWDPATAHLGLVVHPLWAAVRPSKGRGSRACVTFPDPDCAKSSLPPLPLTPF